MKREKKRKKELERERERERERGIKKRCMQIKGRVLGIKISEQTK
jgi:hypothetical protein